MDYDSKRDMDRPSFLLFLPHSPQLGYISANNRENLDLKILKNYGLRSDRMDKKTTYWIVGIAAALLFVALVANLSPFGSPARKPSPARKTMPGYQPPLSSQVQKYRQEPTITLFRHATNTVQEMPLEKYLEGVVAAEVGTKPPMEALKAQAIVSRSLTMAKLVYGKEVKRLHNTDACDLPEHFQAYNEKAVTDNIRQAVKETRGQCVLYQGKFAYALFHSYSGKRTADLSEYFPELTKIASAYIKSLPSPGAAYAPAKEKNWKVAIPKAELASIFGSGADLDKIRIVKRGPSGRAIDIAAGKKTIKAYELRSRLGSQRLKSTLITRITSRGDKVIFQGQGWGHGCGLSQWGAYEMAKKGKKAEQIIDYYFPGCQLVQVWK